jgi:nucleotide-binding universal stress UspA family protein
MAATSSYRIVVGTDFSELANRAFDEALALTRGHDPAELHIVAVVESDHDRLIPHADRGQSLVEITDRVRVRLAAEATAALARFAAAAPSQTRPRAVAHVRVGQIAIQLASLATEIGADLVVVGTHGRRGMQRFMMGSVAEKTVRLAPCPVLVVRPKDTRGMQGLPEILPPCPACVAARDRSEGATWWCETHVSTPEEPHTYSHSHRLEDPYAGAPFGSHQ